jgi:hypothetical protein
MKEKIAWVRLTSLLLSLLLTLEAAALSRGERYDYAMRILEGDPNPLKECLISALELNAFLGMAVVAKVPDDKVRKSLLDSAANKEEIKQLEASLQTWEQDHKPPNAANTKLRMCMQKQENNFDLGEDGIYCFGITQLAVMAEASKAWRRSKQETIVQLEQLFKPHKEAFSEGFARRAVEMVYDNDAQSSQYLAHRRVFLNASCLSNLAAHRSIRSSAR